MMINDDKILVAIYCITYNHEPYIRECLEGFVMQKTNFKFVAIVHDDASTDKTAEIVREYEAKYPEIIMPIYETENQYSKNDGSLDRIMNEAVYATSAKYVAMCEGDDYWTDTYKLQKQVDFLESHPDYVAVAENGLVKNSINNSEYLFSEEIERDLTVRELIVQRRFPTASVVYRSEVGSKMADYTNDWHDTMIWCFLCSRGKFRYFTNVSSVYNRGMQGVVESTERLKWALTVETWNLELKRLFCPKYADKALFDEIIYKQFKAEFNLIKEKNKKIKCVKKMFHYGGVNKDNIKYLCRINVLTRKLWTFLHISRNTIKRMFHK